MASPIDTASDEDLWEIQKHNTARLKVSLGIAQRVATEIVEWNGKQHTYEERRQFMNYCNRVFAQLRDAALEGMTAARACVRRNELMCDIALSPEKLAAWNFRAELAKDIDDLIKNIEAPQAVKPEVAQPEMLEKQLEKLEISQGEKEL